MPFTNIPLVIKDHPSLPIQCRSDGAVLIAGRSWTFGSLMTTGYRCVSYQGKIYRVHRLILEAFVGEAPEDKPFCDHINRIRDDNRPENLHWVDRSENRRNAADVDGELTSLGVRECDDRTAYNRELYRKSEKYRKLQIENARNWQKRNKEKVNAAARLRYSKRKAEEI